MVENKRVVVGKEHAAAAAAAAAQEIEACRTWWLQQQVIFLIDIFSFNSFCHSFAKEDSSTNSLLC